MQTKIFGLGSAAVQGLLRWMDGSLFFRMLVSIFDFFRRVASGSFIFGLFFAKLHGSSQKKGVYENLLDKILNSRFKPFALPEAWPRTLSDIFSQSLLISKLSNALGTPIPASGSAGFRSVFMWVFFAFPAWGTGVVILLAPILPTMTLAYMLTLIIVFTFLSRKFYIDHFAVVLFLFIFINFFVAFSSFAVRPSFEVAILSSVFMAVSIIIPVFAKKEEAINVFIMAFLGGAFLAGLVGLYQHFAGYAAGAWLDEELLTYVTFRVFSTFGNPNVYGIYLLLAIPLAAVGVVYFKRSILKLSCLALTAMLLANLLLTFSRGSYLALAFSAGVFVLLVEKRFIVLFFPALVGSLFFLPQAVIIRIQSILNFQDASTVFRFAIWEGTVRMLRDFWMIGVGQGRDAFRRVYSFYALAGTPTQHTHNVFLQYASEIGVLGLIVFIGLLACYFRAMANFYVSASCVRHKMLAAVFIAAPLGVLLQGMFDHVFFNFGVLLSFYVFLGIGLACSRVLVSDSSAA